MSDKTSQARRRLAPEARRQEIIDAARAVFAERSRSSVSTADVAAAAGVTRALVHHYFHGIEDLRQAVALQILQSAATTLEPSDEASIEDRVRSNVSRFLDVVERNRDTWFATLGSVGETSGTPAGRAMRGAIVERIISNNSEIVDDTAWTRLCLAGYVGFSDGVCRQWIEGHASRGEVETALTETLLHLLQQTIPRTQRAAGEQTTRTRGSGASGAADQNG